MNIYNLFLKKIFLREPELFAPKNLHRMVLFCHRVQRPVRIMLDRNEDMVSSGGRHPFLGRYKVGFTSEGRITALDLRLYSNGGTSQDLSCAVSRGLCAFKKCIHMKTHTCTLHIFHRTHRGFHTHITT